MDSNSFMQLMQNYLTGVGNTAMAGTVPTPPAPTMPQPQVPPLPPQNPFRPGGMGGGMGGPGHGGHGGMPGATTPPAMPNAGPMPTPTFLDPRFASGPGVGAGGVAGSVPPQNPAPGMPQMPPGLSQIPFLGPLLGMLGAGGQAGMGFGDGAGGAAASVPGAAMNPGRGLSPGAGVPPVPMNPGRGMSPGAGVPPAMATAPMPAPRPVGLLGGGGPTPPMPTPRPADLGGAPAQDPGFDFNEWLKRNGQQAIASQSSMNYGG